MLALLLLGRLLGSAETARADSALSAPWTTVSPVVRAATTGGEIQSTIVAPGLNPANCPAGRVLITDDNALNHLGSAAPLAGANDTTHYAATNVVTGFDFDGKKTYPSVFETPFPGTAKSATRPQAGTDHDIITLNDGTVLLIVVGESVSPDHIPYPNKAGDWFNYAYTQTGSSPNLKALGPGVRTVMYVWRSTDCGAHFNWASEIDPANFRVTGDAGPVAPGQFMHRGGDKTLWTRWTDGSCAMPQAYFHGVPPFFIEADGKTVGASPTSYDYPAAAPAAYADPTNRIPPVYPPYYPTGATVAAGATFLGYNQGGTDGPTARVDPRDGAIYLTFQCVGNNVGADPNVSAVVDKPKFVLEGNLTATGNSPVINNHQ